MFQRSIIIAGLVAYALVLIILVHSSSQTSQANGASQAGGGSGQTASSLEGLPFRSVGVQIQRVDWIEDYKKVFAQIAAIGADTVELVVDTRQENSKSSRIYLDYRMTPTTAQLGDLIDAAHKLHLRVILMPVVLLDNPIGDAWRGTIEPENWDDWWNSYRSMIDVFSSVAQVHHVEMLVIGSELVSTEQYVDEWKKTIQLTRDNYKGKLTYSSNWDHYDGVGFWNLLDVVGMNCYWKMSSHEGSAKVKVSEIEEHWQGIQKDLLPFLKKTHKPLFFTEIGWFSQANAAREPWDYTKAESEEPLDLDMQKKLYEAFFQSWYGNPLLAGFSIWEWPPNTGGPEDRGYTPQGKPAENVLKSYLAKGPWQVK
jgi:hypothetical protein